MNQQQRHFEDKIFIQTSAEELFEYIDDHARFSSHMSQSSWMMGGGKMDVSFDKDHGQKVGSYIRMTGKAFGIKLFLEEVITNRQPPYIKTWKTVGNPRLLIIGSYQMGIDIKPQDNHSLLRVFIDYDLPDKNRWLGRLFGKMYAQWCVRRMLDGTFNYFGKGITNEQK